MGLSGNMLINLLIQNSKFDNVFNIRNNFSLSMHNVRNIRLLGFQYNNCGENLSKGIYICLLFSKHVWMKVSHLGLHHLFHLN